MFVELIFRFVIGGLVVCAFAVLGDMLHPKGFAGIFGAAPSVALATVGLTLALHGGQYTSLEGRSMIIGAAAFLLYSLLVGGVLLRFRFSPVMTTGASFGAWAAVAFGLWGLLLR